MQNIANTMAKKKTVPTMIVAMPSGVLTNSTSLGVGVTDSVVEEMVVDINTVLSIVVEM